MISQQSLNHQQWKEQIEIQIQQQQQQQRLARRRQKHQMEPLHLLVVDQQEPQPRQERKQVLVFTQQINHEVRIGLTIIGFKKRANKRTQVQTKRSKDMVDELDENTVARTREGTTISASNTTIDKSLSYIYRAWRVVSYPFRRVGVILWGRRHSNQRSRSRKYPEEMATAITIKNEVIDHDDSTITSVTNDEDLVDDDRSLTAAPGVDLSGDLDLVVTEDFRRSYDRYLMLLGQPFIIRSVALSIVSITTEKTVQSQNGHSLQICGQNIRGTWNRTLLTNFGDHSIINDDDHNDRQTIFTADGECVSYEAWWERAGTLHRSWLRGVQKYGGGSFESCRYLEHNNKDNDVYVKQDAQNYTVGKNYKSKEDFLICESTFHPNDPKREKARLTWRFQRKV